MKVCFVGAGSIGRRHIRNLYHLLQGKEITIDLLRLLMILIRIMKLFLLQIRPVVIFPVFFNFNT